jgi:hypothetical protein
LIGFFQDQKVIAVWADRGLEQVPALIPDVEHLNDLIYLISAQVTVGTKNIMRSNNAAHWISPSSATLKKNAENGCL